MLHVNSKAVQDRINNALELRTQVIELEGVVGDRYLTDIVEPIADELIADRKLPKANGSIDKDRLNYVINTLNISRDNVTSHDKLVELIALVISVSFRLGLLPNPNTLGGRRIVVKANGRLRTTLGRAIIPSRALDYETGSADIELSKRQLTYGTLRQITSTILHEATHVILAHADNINRPLGERVGYDDGDDDFEEMLSVIGAGSSGTTLIDEAVHVYESISCECHFFKYTKLDVKRYGCYEHGNAIAYVGRMLLSEYVDKYNVKELY